MMRRRIQYFTVHSPLRSGPQHCVFGGHRRHGKRGLDLVSFGCRYALGHSRGRWHSATVSWRECPYRVPICAKNPCPRTFSRDRPSRSLTNLALANECSELPCPDATGCTTVALVTPLPSELASALRTDGHKFTPNG